MVTLTLYGKPGCHLCEEARAAVESVRAETPVEVHEVDVSLDPDLNRRYGERIPVLAIDDDEVFELGVAAEELRAEIAHRASPAGR